VSRHVVKAASARIGLAVLAVAGLTAVDVSLASPASAAPVLLNVRDFGATGNGSTNDTGAINRAITAANEAVDGGIVRFPSGTYRSANSIHMKSNVTLQLDSGSTIIGSGADTYDPPESNPFDAFQDYGHSHFHNAMLWGDRLTNIGFTGSGTIDGGGNLITGNPDSGEADKIISLTRCNGLTVDGITLRRGGHLAMLINGCANVTSDRLRIDTASDRDGWNIISTTNVTITNANYSANDDALAFKSDYALGAKLPNGNVSVTDSRLSAVCCNALMFGSETCGDFTGYNFSRITINGSNKSGLGMVSMDGAVISDVHYRDITMTNVRSPIMQKIGTRRRCGNNPGIGRITNITYDNITGTGVSPSFSPTLWGESGSNRITDVTFTNVDLTVPGGSGTISTGVPSNDPNNYNPNSIGTRPAYGWYIHNANGIRFNDSSVQFVSDDDRPAVIANTGSTVVFDGFTAERGGGSPYDMGFQTITGYCVRNSQNTTGGALRISATNSTQDCPPVTPAAPVVITSEAEVGTLTAPMVMASDPAAYAGNYVSVPSAATQTTPSTTGSTTVSFAVPSTGSYKVWGRVIAPADTDDSFWVRVDAGTWFQWNNIPLGSTWHWDDVHDATASNTPVVFSLGAGAHTVTFAYREDGTRLDRILVTNDLALVPSDTLPPGTTRYEAENAAISQGVVESNWVGFSGSGFVNLDNVAGSSVQWTVNAATAGTATLTFRFANGTTTNRPMDITVNGSLASDELAFPGTGAWTTWQTQTITVPLNAGANTVQATGTTANSGPNLDYLEAQL
jgi:polygalacturonase